MGQICPTLTTTCPTTTSGLTRSATTTEKSQMILESPMLAAEKCQGRVYCLLEVEFLFIQYFESNQIGYSHKSKGGSSCCLPKTTSYDLHLKLLKFFPVEIKFAIINQKPVKHIWEYV